MTEVFQFLAALLAAFGLLWLRRTGLWWGDVVIEDCGLDRDGMALARALGSRTGVEFSADDFDRI